MSHFKFQEVCHQYWSNTGAVQFGEYTVDLLGEKEKKENNGFIVRTISIQHKRVMRKMYYEILKIA